MSKLRIGVVFGGRSAEHEVSLVSAASVMNALDKEKYEVVPIGISPEGRWLSSGDALKLLKEKVNIDSQPEHLIVPDPRKKALVPLNSADQNKSVDVLFPVQALQHLWTMKDQNEASHPCTGKM